jgi:glycerol-3-phosphate O-acyltransferase
VEELTAAGAVLKLPPQGLDMVLEEGLAPLIARGLVSEGLQPVASEIDLLRFYAAAIPEPVVAATPQT